MIIFLYCLLLLVSSELLFAGQFDKDTSKRLFNYVSGTMRHNSILSPKVISSLLQQRANINILHAIDTSYRKTRPIHIVTSHLGRFDPKQITPTRLSDIETLVLYGVNLALNDADGKTPFASTLINSTLLKDPTTAETRNAGVMKKLIDLDCPIDEVYEQRISYPYTSLVNQDRHDIIIQQMTPLMMCAYIDDYADYTKESATLYDLCTMPQLLLDHGADVNATDSYGNTALHHIAASISISANQRKHFIKLLLKRNADINQKNNDGKTPLYYASIAYNRSCNVNNKQLVTYLLRKKAEIDKTVLLSSYILTESY